MNITESMRIALRSLSANRMRSGLTMLGIVIGVTSVIAMMSIGQGAQAAITNQITSIGTNLCSTSVLAQPSPVAFAPPKVPPPH